jgi:hypothetical protein
MKRLIFATSAILVLSCMSHASPINCVGATLAGVIANSTHDCILNDLLFTFNTPTSVTHNPPYASTPESYAYFATNGAQPAITNGSDVNLISNATDSLTFQTGDWASRGNASNPSLSQVRTIDIVYTVQAITPGALMTGLASSLPISGPGTVSAKCTSGCTTVPPGGDFTNQGTPVALNPKTPGPIQIEDLVTIGSQTSGQSSHISTLTNAFPVTIVPEPSSMAFGAAGFLILAGLTRKRSKARG